VPGNRVPARFLHIPRGAPLAPLTLEEHTVITNLARRTGAAALTATAAAVLLGVGAPAAGAATAPGNSDLASVRAATAKYHDVDVALADGYVPVSDCEELPGVGAMGIHYLNPQLASDLTVTATQPEVLLYMPTENGLKLVAVEYFEAAVGQPTPSVLGRNFDGPMPGHNENMPTHYDLHLWVWKNNPAGVATAWNPALSCD
jgi:hypothetical protein